MKRLIKFSLAALMTAIVLSVGMLPAFAAAKLKLNDATVKVGDTVSFTLKLGECYENIEGLDMTVGYDSSYLKLDEKSVEFPELKSAVHNSGISNYILFNWTNPVETVNFQNTKAVVTADFKVLKAGESDISYFVSELYGKELDKQITKYTFTYSISVNGKTVAEDKTLPVLDVEKADEELSKVSAGGRKHLQGSFINYTDGKGDDNTDGKNHTAVTGATEAPNTIEVQKDTPSGADTLTIVLCVLAGLLVVAFIVFIIFRSRAKGKDTQ